jgi:RimJ/RimL family protein N-acetyltransferase
VNDSPVLPLRTERLVLRAATPDDLTDMLRYYGDPQVVRHLLHGALDEAGMAEKITKFADNLAPVKTGDTMSLVVDHDGTVIGDVMLRLMTGEPPSVGEIGWVLNPAYGGQGFATEAARAVLALGFGHFGLHRIFAQLDARNTTSAKLCERLGMTKEAHFRQDYWSKGEWTDSLHYGLLRDEWAG